MTVTRTIELLIAILEDDVWGNIPAAERCSPDYVTIPRLAAVMIASYLRSMPKGTSGRPDLWSSKIEEHAVSGLLFDRPIRALAREISEVTGQPEGSARRRLQKMNKCKRLKDLRALKAECERSAARKGGEQSPPVLRR